MPRNRGGMFGSLTFLLGLIFGGFLTLLFSTDEQGETKKEVKSKVSDVKKSLKEVADKERVQAVFGNVSKEAQARYAEAKRLVTEKVSSLRAAMETVDKQKYVAVVNEVADELKKEGALTAQQLKKLSRYLADDYNTLIKKSDNEKAA